MLAEEYRLGGTCISQTSECETSCVLTCVRVNRVVIAVHDRFGSALTRRQLQSQSGAHIWAKT